jgi:hypothetical protein
MRLQWNGPTAFKKVSVLHEEPDVGLPGFPEENLGTVLGREPEARYGCVTPYLDE